MEVISIERMNQGDRSLIQAWIKDLLIRLKFSIFHWFSFDIGQHL